MIESDWKTWLDYFTDSFPEVSKWMTDFGLGTVEAWRRVIGMLDLQDAKSAVDYLLDGKEEIPEAFNRSKFPSVIRRIGEKIARDRRPKEPPEPTPRPGSFHSLRAIADCMRKCVAEGMNPDAVLAEVNRRFPVDERNSRRVKCLDCMDYGWVEVWDTYSVQCAAAGGRIKTYRSLAICHCEAGLEKRTLANGSFEIPPHMCVYEPGGFCKYNRGDVTKLLAWLEDRRKTGRPQFQEFAEFAK
jgi:hypothetical protein